ncbi:MAG: 4-(cytidine 5'-diphospho)-2-C-methyl-D-erythritol kinase [Planctomycetota bacterium]
MKLIACAKINFDLHVLGKRVDRFHELDTVMVNVDLCDILTVELADEISLTCSDPALATDESNLVIKAAKMLATASGYRSGARLHLVKNIPMGGGWGGGSSDAAATLIGLNQLWNLGWDISRLHSLAAQLGSDVAYFLYGGWRRCRGRGEIVEALTGSETWPPLPLLLVLPPLHISTPEVYKRLSLGLWDGKRGYRLLADVSKKIDAWHYQWLKQEGLKKSDLINDLTESARQVEPRLAMLQQILEQKCPGRWLMSGSGAVHFVVLNHADDELKIREALLKADPRLRVVAATTKKNR